MNNFETIIGIEIHLELNTKTKMFSPSINNYGDEPNTNVHWIDLAYPGTLPQVNKQAVVKAIKLAKALKMEIDPLVRFDRKNYFYFDLPKGFQITQNFFPIGKKGQIPIFINEKQINIEIQRIHLEEDTAKSTHLNDKTLLDYNRAGVPLIEIVTEPIIKNANEAALYVEAIRNVAKTLNISDAKMEQGSLRADINISVRPFGQKTLNTKVEIKNINSISNIKKAIEQEVEEQITKITLGKEIEQATKRFNDAINKNVLMRKKGDALDYKYFAEPNLLPIQLSKAFVDEIKIPELHWEKKVRYEKANIPHNYIDTLIKNVDFAKYFDSINYENKNKWVKIFFGEIVPFTKEKSIFELKINPTEIEKMLSNLEKGNISSKHIKTIIPLLINDQKTFDQIVKEKNLVQISDEKAIKKLINEVIEENQEFIMKNMDRFERVLKFTIGNVMKKSKGQVNPFLTDKLVKEILNAKK